MAPSPGAGCSTPSGAEQLLFGLHVGKGVRDIPNSWLRRSLYGAQRHPSFHLLLYKKDKPSPPSSTSQMLENSVVLLM